MTLVILAQGDGYKIQRSEGLTHVLQDDGCLIVRPGEGVVWARIDRWSRELARALEQTRPSHYVIARSPDRAAGALDPLADYADLMIALTLGGGLKTGC